MESLAVRSGAVDLSDYGRDPDCVEAKVLNIVELVDDTLPSATTIHPILRVALWAGTVSLSETVDNELQRGAGQHAVSGTQGEWKIPGR